MRLFFAFCLFSAGALNASDDGRLILQNIRQKVSAAISRSDNYICAQDLARFYYNAPKACQQPFAGRPQRLLSEDRLKLDVAVSQGSEIYSWHGEQRFAAANVGQVVREGPISSGSFNGYLRNIFTEPEVKFTYRGQSEANGTNLASFDYAVPLPASHYQLQTGKNFVMVPFHGAFSADTDSFELHSLTVSITEEQIPRKADICSVETRLIYQRVIISNHASLLPASFDLLLGSRAGMFTESKGKYSQCREYSGESTLLFDVDATAGQSEAPKLANEPLPAGVHLQIALRGQIDEDSAYAGMPVQAMLTHDVKIAKGVVLQRGAILKGTITRFQIFHRPAHTVAMKLEFSTVSDGGKLYLCNAVREVAPVFSQAPSIGRRGGIPSRGLNEVNGPGDSSIIFTGPHMHLDAHFASLFVTVNLSDSEPR